ncbi:winged helix-turn-helix transcriptional regulator [Cohnella hashimotonis]|uniref:Helix-turn-helix domain-containing protein n=1 Tax=Cohnella hashimotonis TaxID=2826895 RepID=A0ABT6TQB4_9BACL|nr:helix-turn-helix domain-containing protein [Cohnella hashimotonis]
MREPDISIAECSYRRVLEIVSNKWTALVIYALEDGTLRYGLIKSRIADISQKMLTQTLKQLERDGLVVRKVTPVVPPVVDYALTPLGRTLLPFLRMLKDWSSAHYASVSEAREAYDAVHQDASHG